MLLMAWACELSSLPVLHISFHTGLRSGEVGVLAAYNMVVGLVIWIYRMQ